MMSQGHHGTCAALEYAVTALKVPLVMVMGHAQCGGAAHALSICSKVWPQWYLLIPSTSGIFAVVRCS